MGDMQAEILAANPDSRIRLFGINQAGSEFGNDFVTGTIPLLQDAADGAWTTWKPVYRDVVILDAQNRKVGVFNLTDHDLQVQEEYDTLKAMLLDIAGETPPPKR